MYIQYSHVPYSYVCCHSRVPVSKIDMQCMITVTLHRDKKLYILDLEFRENCHSSYTNFHTQITSVGVSIILGAPFFPLF